MVHSGFEKQRGTWLCMTNASTARVHPSFTSSSFVLSPTPSMVTVDDEVRGTIQYVFGKSERLISENGNGSKKVQQQIRLSHLGQEPTNKACIQDGCQVVSCVYIYVCICILMSTNGVGH